MARSRGQEFGFSAMQIAGIVAVLAIVSLVVFLSFKPQAPTPGAASPTPLATGFQSISKTFPSETLQSRSAGVSIEVTKTVSITFDKFSDGVVFKNNGASTQTFVMLEIVPKTLASSVSELRFTTTGTGEQNVIDPDPLIQYRWTLPAGSSFQHYVTGKGGVDSAIIRVQVLDQVSDEQLQALIEALKPLQRLNMTHVLAVEAERSINRVLNDIDDARSFEDKVADVKNYVATLGAPSSAPAPLPAVQPLSLGKHFEVAVPQDIVVMMRDVELNPVAEVSLSSSKEPLVTGFQGKLRGKVAATTSRLPNGDWLVTLRVNVVDSRFSGGVIDSDNLTDQIIFGTPGEAPKNASFTVLMTHVDPEGFIFEAPTNVVLEDTANGTVQKPVFLTNNYPYRSTVQLAGKDVTIDSAGVFATYTPLQAGVTEILQGGKPVAVLNASTAPTEEDKSRLVPDLPRQTVPRSWRHCADHACDCRQTQIALDLFLEKFDKDLAAIQDPALYARTFGADFSESIPLLTQDNLDQCAFSAPFESLSLNSRAAHAVKLTATLSGGPFTVVRASTTQITSDSLALQSELAKSNLYATPTGVQAWRQ